MKNFFTYDLYLALAPWLVFALLSVLAIILMKLAKKRRGIAIAMVVSEKRAIKKQQEEDGEGQG
jgi:hypothetical protein